LTRILNRITWALDPTSCLTDAAACRARSRSVNGLYAPAAY
jgi:hypothetical protein